MTDKKRFILYLIGVILMFVQLGIYIYFMSILKPSYTDLSAFDNILSAFLIIVFISIGLIHVFLFIDLLKHIPDVLSKLWKFSIALVLFPISGIILLSDVTILSDIGKEYLLFDISTEWYMLFVFSFLHLITFIYSWVITKNFTTEKYRFIEAINSGNETMYKSLNQITIISSVSGIIFSILFIFNIFDFLTYEKHIVALALIMMMLLVIPIAIFIGFWIIKFYNKPISKWLDENEWFITIKGMAIALINGWILICIGILLSVLITSFSIIIWLIMTIFIQLAILSIYSLLKYRY